MYNNKKNTDPVDGGKVWGALVVSMKEASLALCNPKIDPYTLCKSLNIGTKTVRDVVNGDADSPSENFTPECFDDWRAGGYTQNTTQGVTRFSVQTQSQALSQGLTNGL